MLPNLQFPTDLVTFTVKILNGKLHFLCSEMSFLRRFNPITNGVQNIVKHTLKIMQQILQGF